MKFVRKLISLTPHLINSLFVSAFLVVGLTGMAQISSVTSTQSLSFGAFSSGNSGGTIVINSFGARSSTGTISLFNLGTPYHAAIFEIEAHPGTIVSITKGSNVSLTGSNGGSMTLHIVDSNPGSPFITSATLQNKTVLHIGGILTVGSAGSSPPGNYTGSFHIIFNNE